MIGDTGMKHIERLCYAVLCGAMALGAAQPTLAQAGDNFSNWPKGASPEEVGKKVPTLCGQPPPIHGHHSLL